MLNNFREGLLKEKLVNKGDGVLLGVSGGVDSMVMLDLFCRVAEDLSLHIIACHINYHKRGKESDLDQELVERVCGGLNVPVEVVDFHAAATAENFQNEARRFRYSVFERIAQRYSLEKIATAHNLNDHVETVIAHILRGAGLTGAAGIRRRYFTPNGKVIIRPLSTFKRKEILKYADKEKVIYREDASNLSLDYQRNKIRHNVIPRLVELNASALEHISNFSKDIADAASFIEGVVSNAMQRHLKIEERRLLLDRAIYKKHHRAVRYAMLRSLYQRLTGNTVDLYRRHLDALDLISTKKGSYRLPGNVRFECNDAYLSLEYDTENE